MDNATKPIAASASLSILLHAVVFAASLLVYEQAATLSEGVGRGIEIELISSMMVSQQKETSLSRSQSFLSKSVSQAIPVLVPEPEHEPEKNGASSSRALTSLSNVEAITVSERLDDARRDDARRDDARQNNDVGQKQRRAHQLITGQVENTALVKQSTSASEQQHSIIERLHSRISENKDYPYLARRQRREGTSTVAFVLHPDGSLENARLVSSSQTMALDRAALAAVKRIEPFSDARQYIEQAKEFQIDVVFELL